MNISACEHKMNALLQGPPTFGILLQYEAVASGHKSDSDSVDMTLPAGAFGCIAVGDEVLF